MGKKYYVCNDLIELAGDDSLRNLGKDENVIWADMNEIEKRADDSRERNAPQFQEALKFIHSGDIDFENKQILLPTGGFLKWEDGNSEVDNNVVRVTKKSGLISQYKRQGIAVEEPEFLRFGGDLLERSLIDVTWNHSQEEMTAQRLEETLGEEIPNNRILRINNGKIVSFRYPCEAVGKYGRYRLDEENPYLEELPEHVGTKLKGFELGNLEQKIGTWQLLDPNVEVHFVIGGSGSGKSVLTYATAIDQILGTEKNRKKKTIEDLEKEIYEGILLFKSNDQIGGKDREEGYRPGDDFEKARPFISSFMDAHSMCGVEQEIPFEQLLYHPEKTMGDWPQRSNHKIGEFYLPSRTPAVTVEHLRFARGRTFENRLLFVDEAQNYTPYEMKQLIERVGLGSKLYIVGDPVAQIDNAKLDENFNGLTYALDVLYGTHPRATLTVLDQNFRSQTAEIGRSKKAPKV